MAPTPNPEPLAREQIQEILARLDHVDGEFPHDEVAEVMARREEFVPHFLRILEETAEDPQRVSTDQSAMAHVFAVYLLAYFRESSALPLIIRIFSLPEPMVSNIFGDVVTQDLGKILASVCAGETAPLHALVEDKKISEHVRSQALDAFQNLVVEGIRKREELVDYCRFLFQTFERDPTDYLWSALACVCADLALDELREEINQAWDDGLIDPMVVTRDEVERDLAVAPEAALARLREHDSSMIDDPARHMSWMSVFQKEWRQEPSKPALSVQPETFQWPTPMRREQPKVGRNEPCPCGSGKKYKKCCGG